MLAASVPENSGQPNALASSGMLIGSTLPLNATSMLSRAEIAHGERLDGDRAVEHG